MSGHGGITSSQVHGKDSVDSWFPRSQLFWIFTKKEGCPITGGLGACTGKPNITKQHEIKRKSSSLLLIKPLCSPQLSLPLGLSKNEVPGRDKTWAHVVLIGKAERRRGREQRSNFEIWGKSKRGQSLMNRITTTWLKRTTGWWESNEEKGCGGQNPRRPWGSPAYSYHKTPKHSSMYSRGTRRTLWKQTACHTNCCLKLPMPRTPRAAKQSLFNAK